MVMEQNNSGVVFQEVAPGSAGDPFSARNAATSAANLAGIAIVGAGDGPKFVPATASDVTTQPAPTAAAPAATPAVVPATPAIQTPAPTVVAEPSDKVAAEIEALQRALRAQQSAFDRKLNETQEALKAAQEAQIKSERESKLSAEDLTDDEKDLLRNKFRLEDMERDLEERERQSEEFFRATFIAKLTGENEKYGVTADELEALEEPEEMENLVLSKKIAWYESGNFTPTPAPVAVVETPEPAPAGASAPSDLGGTSVVATPPQISQGTGRDAMAESLKALPWVSIPIS